MQYDELGADEVAHAREQEARHGLGYSVEERMAAMEKEAARKEARRATREEAGRDYVDDEGAALDAELDERQNAVLDGNIYCAECGLDIRHPGWVKVGGEVYHEECRGSDPAEEFIDGAAMVKVEATAEVWSRVWGELAWLDDETPDGEPGRLLAILVDNTPPGVEEYEDSTEISYVVELLAEDAAAIERVTGIDLR
ncbi:MAG: hypothetical protein M3Q10_20075 [Chloroflexota bacterium]|nr:hypothetical protein [Chloroflexota bacterium]